MVIKIIDSILSIAIKVDKNFLSVIKYFNKKCR